MENNEICRCPWLDATKADYVEYHDKEWGEPVYDDTRLFEFLTLESAQAGLSWYTILKRREGYRKAFEQFDVNKVANYTIDDVERLLLNSEIIRHKGKIEATINNAKRFIEIQNEYGSFSTYLWAFVGNKTIVNNFETLADYPATTEISDKLSKDLKKKGFKFVGSTTIYAYMQACGMVNDHSVDCFKRNTVANKL